MKFLSHLLLALPALLPTVAAEGDLHDLIVASGKAYFGTATDTNFLANDTIYAGIVNVTSEFGLIVPENSQKWELVEPQPGVFDFTEPDKLVALARANGQTMRCHTLIWHQQLPAYIVNGTWSRENLTLAIQAHITTVVQHFKGACTSWDVVNEALNDGNGTFRQSIFFRVLGTDYIPIAFKAAAAADPDAKLYYNDFSIEFNNSKTEGALRIVKLIQDAGARIDGVGFQSHMIVGQTPTALTLAATLNRFVALGVEVALTELDIRFARLPANESMIEQQAIDYAEMVNGCLMVPKCVGVVVWQFTDKFSWIPSTFPGAGDACPFNANMTRKPAYTSVSALLAAASTAAAVRTSELDPSRMR